MTPAGGTAVIVVEFTTVNEEAFIPLNFTAVAPVKFNPVKVIVGVVPVHIAVGEKLVIDGYTITI